MGFRPKKCKVCGVKFVPLSRNNTICPNPECKKIGNTVAKAKYRKMKKERAAKENKRVVQRQETLTEINEKARAMGLSYGKYMLLLENERRGKDGNRLRKCGC